MLRDHGRVVNLRFTIGGLRFDAAIDCDWVLHAYSEGLSDKSKFVPIELYCFDHEDWDIRMCYLKRSNDQQMIGQTYGLYHTEVELDFIMKEAKDWIKEMLGNSNFNKNNEKDINTLF